MWMEATITFITTKSCLQKQLRWKEFTRQICLRQRAILLSSVRGLSQPSLGSWYQPAGNERHRPSVLRAAPGWCSPTQQHLALSGAPTYAQHTELCTAQRVTWFVEQPQPKTWCCRQVGLERCSKDDNKLLDVCALLPTWTGIPNQSVN